MDCRHRIASGPRVEPGRPENAAVSSTVVQVSDARCALRKRTIFSGISFALRPGDRILLAGPNGSGKTTLLRCIGGTLDLTGGTIRVGGAPAGSPGAAALTGLCVNPEQGLHLKLSGHDNLLFAARLRMPARQVNESVDRVERELAIGAFAAQQVQSYSAGMRARVSIARALLGDPRLLLIDEPTRSLDEQGRELFWAALDRRPHVACLIASHLPTDSARCGWAVTLPAPVR